MAFAKSRIAITVAVLAGVVVIQAAAAYFISRRAAEAAVQREAEIAQDFLNSILRGHKLESDLFTEPSALADFTGSIAGLPDLIRANVYSPDGIIRYSSQQGLTGVKFEEHNDELAQAFAGTLAAELVTVSGASKAEHLALPLKTGEAFIEAYVPVSGEDGKPLAVVELYKRPTGLAASIAKFQRVVVLAAAIAGVALFAVIALLLRLGQPASREP